jgi:ferredoxin-like protein FixX
MESESEVEDMKVEFDPGFIHLEFDESGGSSTDNDDDDSSSDCDDEALYYDSYYDDINAYYSNRDHTLPETIGSYVVHTEAAAAVKVSNRDIRDIDGILLECAKKEYDEVLTTVRAYSNNKSLSPFDLFEMFFTKTMRHWMIQWIADYSMEPNRRSISDDDILAFMRLDLLAQYYHATVTHMTNPTQQHHYRLGEYMTGEIYHYMMRSLNNGMKNIPSNSCQWNDAIQRNPKIMTLFEEFGRNCARICFVSGTSMIALDHDLRRHCSKNATLNAMLPINILQKGRGSIHHAAVSVTTGLYCGGYLQYQGDTTVKCVTKIQQILCHSPDDRYIHLNGTGFYMDHGYGGTDGEIVQSLMKRGGNYYGTVKKMNLYSCGESKIRQNQAFISKKGASTTYESQKEIHREYGHYVKNNHMVQRKVPMIGFTWLRMIRIAVYNAYQMYMMLQTNTLLQDHSDGMTKQPAKLLTWLEFQRHLSKLKRKEKGSFQCFIGRLMENIRDVLDSSHNGKNSNGKHTNTHDSLNVQSYNQRDSFFTVNSLMQIRQSKLTEHKLIHIKDKENPTKVVQRRCVWCCETKTCNKNERHSRRGYKTSFECNICRIPLCKSARGGNTTSCYNDWHVAERLNNPCLHHLNNECTKKRRASTNSNSMNFTGNKESPQTSRTNKTSYSEYRFF